jgi:RHS repeat-associated protein
LQPKLCATRDSFPAYNPPTKCELAVTGATDLGTILYNHYQDSLRNVFEDNYLRKCLKIAGRETFTVSDSSSEYHYTLYYYDQAGNLVKTVPPEGVNLSKMDHKTSWSDSVKAARLARQQLPVVHGLPTLYRYNTLNQVTTQNTPDAGISRFWYDRLGRLAVSQNAKQRTANGTLAELNRKYSYTLYSDIGRITEVGEYTNASSTTITQQLSRDKSSLNNWLNNNTNRREVVRTTYDVANPLWAGISAADIPVSAQNLRNRVSYTQYYPLGAATDINYSQATFYSYDIHGNVDTLVQDYANYTADISYRNIMNNNGLHNRFKKMVYQYDLISGKVNHVAYQPQYRKGANIYRPADAIYHKYEYDAENRLTAAYTSIDSIVWEKDAGYDYYKHGPLARTEIGEQRVQGIDYAYTIQGWLKGVNSSSLSPDKDMGLDGSTINLQNRYVGRDALGFSLNYFNGDYSSIASGAGTNSMPQHTADAGVSNGLTSSLYRPLYNGNISSMLVNIGKLNIPDASGTGTTAGAVLYNYKYDQLNRLVAMDAYKGLTAANNSWANIISLPHYKENITYDGNGNILTYQRNGNKTSQQIMDNLGYVYNYHTSGVLNGKLKSNQLKQVTDAITNAGAYDESDAASGVSDIEHQAANNYVYDSIGNLIKDTKENINSINWNVYGKITDINFAFIANKVKKISYAYDASGNRIGKVVEKYAGTSGGTTSSTYTRYSRDASGNVMAVYSSTGSGPTLPSTINVIERHLYGSSRLGLLAEVKDAKVLPVQAATSHYLSSFIRGNKIFELTNHLGNVLVTISDKKIGVDEGTYGLVCPSCAPPPTGIPLNCECYLTQQSTIHDGIADYYIADVITANDYYPFGMQMPGRKYAATGKYRYGFNGKENDNEVKGEGNQQDYGMRIYDPRLGRFLSVDPLVKKYPMLTPYQFASNRPIDGVDLDGLEYLTYTLVYLTDGNGPAKLQSSYSVWHNSKEHNAHGDLGKGVKYNIEIRDKKSSSLLFSDTRFVSRQTQLLGGVFKTDYGNYMGPTSLYKFGGDDDYFNENFSRTYDYTLPGVDAVDDLARIHDMAYDKIGAVGQNSLMNDFGTTPADIAALKGWEDILSNKEAHSEVNKKGRDAALNAAILFRIVATKKVTAISKFMKNNYSKEATKDVTNNYNLFLIKYMEKDGDGNLRRKEDMWLKDKNGDWKPNKSTKTK